VLEGNQQLRETIRLLMGRSQREVYLRYVYDLKSAANSDHKEFHSPRFSCKNGENPRPGRVDGNSSE